MTESLKVLSQLSNISEHYGVLARQILSSVFVNILLCVAFSAHSIISHLNVLLTESLR